jgi:hypothetical protein
MYYILDKLIRKILAYANPQRIPQMAVTQSKSLFTRFESVLKSSIPDAPDEDIKSLCETLVEEAMDFIAVEAAKKPKFTLKKPVTSTTVVGSTLLTKGNKPLQPYQRFVSVIAQLWRHEARKSLSDDMVTLIKSRESLGSKSVVEIRASIIANKAIVWDEPQPFGAVVEILRKYEPDRMKITGLLWLVLDDASRVVVCS